MGCKPSKSYLDAVEASKNQQCKPFSPVSPPVPFVNNAQVLDGNGPRADMESRFTLTQQCWFNSKIASEAAGVLTNLQTGAPLYRIQIGRQKLPPGNIKGSYLNVYDGNEAVLCKVIRCFDSCGIGLQYRVATADDKLLAIIVADLGFWAFHKVIVRTYSDPRLPWDAAFDPDQPQYNYPTVDAIMKVPSPSDGLLFVVEPQGTFEDHKRTFNCHLQMADGSKYLVATTSSDESVCSQMGVLSRAAGQYVTRVAPGMSDLLMTCIDMVVDEVILEKEKEKSQLKGSDHSFE